MKFSVGFNHDLNLFDLLDSRFVSSVYFPVSVKFSGSGRSLPQPVDYEKQIPLIISKCCDKGIGSNLLLNSSCDPVVSDSYINRVVGYLKSLDGLDSVTVVNPLFVPEIRSKTDLEVHSSVNCFVRSVEHAEFLVDLGVDVLVPDRDVNRDFSLLRDFRGISKLKLLANEGCLRNCPFRSIHFNVVSHGGDCRDFDNRSCITVLNRHPEKFFHIPFIRPEDLQFYTEFTDVFKLATRSWDSVKIALVLDAYVNKKWDGDLLFLLSGKGIFSKFEFVDNRKLGSDFLENIKKPGFDLELLKSVEF